MSGGFDTEVRGEPGTLRDCVRWLRGTVAGDLRDAADRQASARRDAAGGWEGASCEAYRDVGAAAVSATDDHAARVGRAADDVEGVADRMAELRRTMAEVRGDARAAGLGVEGTRVLVPFPTVPLGPQGVLPGAGDGAGDTSYAAKRAAYDRLERLARTERRDAEDWIADHLARAGRRAAERGDVDVLHRRLTGPAPSGGAAAPAPVPAPTGSVNGLAGAVGASAPSAPSAPGGGGGASPPEGGRSQDGIARVVPVEPPSRGRVRDRIERVEHPGRGDRLEKAEDTFVEVEDTFVEVEDSWERVVDVVVTLPGGRPTAEPGEVPVAAPGVRRDR